MKLLEKILVPVDIDMEINNLVKNVKNVASKYESDVILLCTIPREFKKKTFAKTLEKIAREKLDEIKKKLKGIHTSLDEVAFANPLENIIKYSRTENVNVILTSPNLHKEEDENITSPLVEKLVRKSEKPVWIVKDNSHVEIKNILCPVDFSNASERAMKNSIQLARKYKAKIFVLNTYTPFITTSERFKIELQAENKLLKTQHENDMKTFLSKFNLVDLDYHSEVMEGYTNQVINKFVKDKKIDIVTIGTTGKNNFGKILVGSITEKLIRELPCSVITTKSTDIINLRLENETRDIEMLTEIAKDLMDNGFYKEAIGQYELCLRINDMHIPSHYRIAKAYQKLGNEEKAEQYQQTATELMRRIWDKKIEYEVRKHYFD